MRILIVEDEPKTGDYLKQGLAEAGFVVDLVRDGTDGLDAEQGMLAVDEYEIVPAGFGDARDVDRAHGAHVHAERDLACLEELLEWVRCIQRHGVPPPERARFSLKAR